MNNLNALKALAINYLISSKLDNLVKDPNLETEEGLLTFKIGKQSLAIKIEDISKHGSVLNEICVQKYLTMLADGYTLFNYKSGWVCTKDDELYELYEDNCSCGDFCFRKNKPTFIGCKHQLMLKGFQYFYAKSNQAKLKFMENN